MPDLIDRGALPVGSLHGWEYVSKHDLDASEPVTCGACKYGEYVNTWAESLQCPDCYCGSNFERREGGG